VTTAPILLSSYSSSIPILSTTLNALANNAAILSPAIDNRTLLALKSTWFLKLGTQTARTGSPAVLGFILPSPDGGTTYPDAITTGIPDMVFFPTAAVTGLLLPFRGVSLDPGLFKILLLNATSQTFAATGNTLDALFYSNTVG
jgi:hypothetical protein